MYFLNIAGVLFRPLSGTKRLLTISNLRKETQVKKRYFFSVITMDGKLVFLLTPVPEGTEMVDIPMPE